MSVVSTCGNTFAQDDDLMGFADVPAVFNAQDGAGQVQYPDKFNAAQEALSQGLTRKQAGSVKHTFPSPEEIRQGMQGNSASSDPQVRRIKSPVEAKAPESMPELAAIPVVHEISAQKPAPQVKSLPAPQPKTSSTVTDRQVRKTQQAAPAKETALQGQLSASESRVRDLERQLSDSKSALAAAELEITRLSTIVQNNSRTRLNLPLNEAPKLTSSPVVPGAAPSTVKPPLPTAEKSADAVSDMQVATVSVEKADLRLGPGKNNSALMTLRKGSRLAVEARQGEWYRVFAPNGQRAWIHSSLVRFGEGAASMNDGSSIRMRGFDAALN